MLKSCLVLGDFPDVKFKVDNFTKDNILKIERSWEKITAALRTTIKLYASLGFYRNSLSSSSIVIPVAYYIMVNNLNELLITSNRYAQCRQLIREWLIRSLLKRVFSGTPDAHYPAMRRIIRENETPDFPLQQFMDHYKGANKSILFSEEDLNSLLDLEYKSPFTYSVLALLYPGLNKSFHYHKDHIHPLDVVFRSKAAKRRHYRL